jgi:hypothetical protein
MSTHADAIGLRPTSAAELAEILAADSTPYEIAGFGSKRAIGQPVDAARLDLSALAGIVDYRPSELVLTASRGRRSTRSGRCSPGMASGSPSSRRRWRRCSARARPRPSAASLPPTCPAHAGLPPVRPAIIVSA